MNTTPPPHANLKPFLCTCRLQKGGNCQENSGEQDRFIFDQVERYGSHKLEWDGIMEGRDSGEGSGVKVQGRGGEKAMNGS